jgi:hypothetical protein
MSSHWLEVFAEEHQTDWSIRVLDRRSLPAEVPDVVAEGLAVPLAFTIDEPFGAVLHVLLWDDGLPRCDVEVLIRRTDGWESICAGGAAWPSMRLTDLPVEQLGGRAATVLGECGVGHGAHDMGAFTYGIASTRARGVEFTDPYGERRHWPKLRAGAFVVPTRIIAMAS